MKLSRPVWLCAIGSLAFAVLAGCNGGENGGKKRLRFGYVTNCVAEFWVVAEAGVRKAGKDLDVEVEPRNPPDGTVADQKRMVQELLTKGIDGIAISPIDPANQQDLLDEIANNTILVTQDSDAPNSKRQVFIGVDNYTAGRACGKLIKKAIPDGGELMIFVGRLGQLNAQQRRQGIIDELMERSEDPTRYDEPGHEIKNDKYNILDTRTDDTDRVKAKSIAQDAITKYPNLKCMVGLFSYNPPKLIDAVKEADKVGRIIVTGFDEEEETLQGVKDGVMFGTIVQDPYMYGYKSIEVLKKLKEGDKSVIPENKFISIPVREITKENLMPFWTELNERVGRGAPTP